MDVLYKFLHFLVTFEADGEHLVAHCAGENFGHTLAHNHLTAITLTHLVIGVYILVAVAAGGKCAVIFILPRQREGVAGIVLIRRGDLRFVIAYHVRPNLVNVGGVRIIDHVGRVATGGTHIDLQRYKIALVAESLAVAIEAEKFEVYKPTFHVESLYGFSADKSQ